MNILDPESAPERWLAQDAILREARFQCRQGLYLKAMRLVALAVEIAPLGTQEHRDAAESIQKAHDRHHRKAA